MENMSFKVRGKVIRMARHVKNISLIDFAKAVNIEADYLAKMEREVRSISKLNEIRIIRGLKNIGITDAQIVAIQLIVEHEETGD